MRTLVSAATFDVQNKTVHSRNDVESSAIVNHRSTNVEDNLGLRGRNVGRSTKVNNKGTLHSRLLRRGSGVSLN